MINAGVGLHLVSRALGHSNTTITEKRYAHVSSKTMLNAVNCASSIIEKAMQPKPLTIEATAVEIQEVKDVEAFHARELPAMDSPAREFPLEVISAK